MYYFCFITTLTLISIDLKIIIILMIIIKRHLIIIREHNFYKVYKKEYPQNNRR